MNTTMQTTDILKIPQGSLEESFNNHLEIENNYRILFSGPFGQGKTTFLDKVFQDQRDKYVTIKLYPVNYAVSSNEDVFELIKFDILTQIIGFYGDELNLENEDFSKILTAQLFIRDKMNFVPWLENILGCFGSIGKSAKGFLEAMKKTIQDFEAFHQEVQLNEVKDIDAFVDKLINSPGSAIEMDIISQMTKKFVNRLKENTNKSVILVIDDLDRLDPDHIFRLFNVFSTHFENIGEHSSSYNKFGFDRILFVCDIENIRKIYRHKYGAGVDFKGYLDKFYSQQPFDFDNRIFINNHVHHILGKVKGFEENDIFQHSISAVFEWILISLVNNRQLNLRSLIQVSSVDIKDIEINISSSRLKLSAKGYPVIFLLQVLLGYYPSLEILSEKLNVLASLYDRNRIHSRNNSYRNSFGTEVISMCIPFLIHNDHGFKRTWEDHVNKVSYSSLVKAYIHFNTKEIYDYDCVSFSFSKATIEESSESDIVEINPYHTLDLVLLSCKRIGILD